MTPRFTPQPFRPTRRACSPRVRPLATVLIGGLALACSSSGSPGESMPSDPGADDPAAGGSGFPSTSSVDSMMDRLADAIEAGRGTGSSAGEGPGTPQLPLESEPEDPATPDAPGPEASLSGSVAFSRPSGTFEGSIEVEMSTEADAAQIRYTTDGSLPDATSPVYSGGPLSFADTVQLRARTFVDSEPTGDPSTALYVARSFDAESDLPLIVVEGYGAGKPEDRDLFVDMAFMVFEPTDGVAALSNPPTLSTRAGYHLRGQSSASFDKAPYRVELWDNADEDADLPVLGMPAEADWALIGPFADRSLIRHAFAYDLGPELGMFAPRYAFAEVYVNQDGGPLEAADYEGVYMLVETIKNNSNRIDLAQLREEDTTLPDISGGYIFKFDWAAAEEPTLACTGSAPLSGGFGFGGGGNNGGTCWNDLEVVDPVPLGPEQQDFITGYLQQFHDSLHEQSFAEYAQYIDVDSFVDNFIVNELTRDIDAYTRSAFYHKERDQPLTAGPLWDYNLTLGVGFGANRNVQGWQWEEREVASDWFRILAVDPDFMSLVSQRWAELRAGTLSEAQLDARVARLAAPLAAAAERDFERWPVAAVSGGIFQLPAEPTWAGQIEVLTEWLHERAAWLDSQL